MLMGCKISHSVWQKLDSKLVESWMWTAELRYRTFHSHRNLIVDFEESWSVLRLSQKSVSRYEQTFIHKHLGPTVPVFLLSLILSQIYQFWSGPEIAIPPKYLSEFFEALTAQILLSYLTVKIKNISILLKSTIEENFQKQWISNNILK